MVTIATFANNSAPIAFNIIILPPPCSEPQRSRYITITVGRNLHQHHLPCSRRAREGEPIFSSKARPLDLHRSSSTPQAGQHINSRKMPFKKSDRGIGDAPLKQVTCSCATTAVEGVSHVIPSTDCRASIQNTQRVSQSSSQDICEYLCYIDVV